MEVLTHKAELLRRPASARPCTSPEAMLNSRHRTASANGLQYGSGFASRGNADIGAMTTSASYTVGHLSGLLRAVDPTATLGRRATVASEPTADLSEHVYVNTLDKSDGRRRTRETVSRRSGAEVRRNAGGLAKSRLVLDLTAITGDGGDKGGYGDSELAAESRRDRSLNEATASAQRARQLRSTTNSNSAQAAAARGGELNLQRQRSRSAAAALAIERRTDQPAASEVRSGSALSSSARSTTSSEAQGERRRLTERRESEGTGRRCKDGDCDDSSTTLFGGSRMGLTASGAIVFPGEEQLEESSRLARIMILAERCAEQAFDLEPPVPRVKPEAYDNAELAKGRRMAKLLHKYGDVTPRPRDPPRVKPEGEPNAALDRGRRMALLIHSYGRLPPSPRQPPRVKQEAEEIAYHGRNGLAHHLLDSYGRLPPSPRPQARVHREARSTAHRARGTAMKRALTEMGKKQFIYVPGMQARKHERKMTI